MTQYLPAWPTLHQAITWLATGDVALALACHPRPTGPVVDLSLIAPPRQLSPVELARISGQGEVALRDADRAALAGLPWGWDNWFSFLRARSGSDLKTEVETLARAALAGEISARSFGRIIYAAEWATGGLVASIRRTVKTGSPL
jgi:hypothetical protein